MEPHPPRRATAVAVRVRTDLTSNAVENADYPWEEQEAVNLSYQNLGQPSQRKSLALVLPRLQRCQKLSMHHNGVVQPLRVRLPNLLELGLSFNRIRSFAELPKAPQLRRLDLSYNCIQRASALTHRFPLLEELTLVGCPICFTRGYRKAVARALRSLRVLDGRVVDRTEPTRGGKPWEGESEGSPEPERPAGGGGCRIC